MRKIRGLIDHLLAVTGLPREQVEAFADKGALMSTGRDLGPDGQGRAQVEAGVWKYDAVIRLQRYAGDGPTLMAVVLGWLADADPDRDGLVDPELDVAINDAHTCDVEIACEFEERLVIREDPQGPVAFDGRHWSMALPDISVADAVSGMRGQRG